MQWSITEVKKKKNILNKLERESEREPNGGVSKPITTVTKMFYFEPSDDTYSCLPKHPYTIKSGVIDLLFYFFLGGGGWWWWWGRM